MLQAKMSDWNAILGVLGSVVKEITIATDGERATCMAVDPSHVLFAKCSIDCQGQVPTFTVSADQMLKALSAAGGKEPKVEFNQDRGTLRIIGNAKVNLPLISYDDEVTVKDISAQEMFADPDTSSEYVPAELEPLIAYGTYSKEQECVFSAKNGKLSITVGNGQKQSEIECGTATGNGATTKCSLDYISLINKQAKMAEKMEVLMPGDSMPVLFRWTAGETASVLMLLAPWIDDE